MKNHGPKWENPPYEVVIASNPTDQTLPALNVPDDLREYLREKIEALIQRTETDMLQILAFPNPPSNALREGKELLDGFRHNVR